MVRRRLAFPALLAVLFAGRLVARGDSFGWALVPGDASRGSPRGALVLARDEPGGRGVGRARSKVPAIAGRYGSPLGEVAILVKGAAVTGTLLAPGSACAFHAGEEVLRGTVLDDSVAGQLRVCLGGDGCRVAEAWGEAVLLAGPGGLSGAVHVAEQNCTAPLGPKGGVSLSRLDSGGHPGEADRGEGARAHRERARVIARDGAAWLREGNFEAARKRFLEALEVDPGYPEALNGVGVTYRMRNDLEAALGWYKKALGVDPDFGDAYYNMACVYALKGDRALALRYLQIAAMNGYATAEGIEADPDLASLHDEPGYRALVKARL